MKGMKNMFKFLNRLDKNEIMDWLLTMLEENCQDFPEIQQTYIQAIESLKTCLGEEGVQKETDAICQQISSVVLFSGVLGIQANYQYFSNPVSGNFLGVDPEAYLQENVAHNLPEYTAAQQARSRFYDSLTPAQKELYQPIIAYTSYLETVGPKLAHYYGFLLGNEFLPQVVPGYHPNMAITLQYCIKLESYFGKGFNFNNVLKSSFRLA